ncbi:MAG: polysaccharide deacetylase family protein [Desulfovibrio sp.]|nr:polysaccharide deacetylase family protein [Mailhella sp.]
MRFSACLVAAWMMVLGCAPAPAGAGQEGASWSLTASDGKGVLPNDPSPPPALGPGAGFPPALPASDQGTIRSVDTGGEKAVALTFDMCELAVSTTGCDMEILSYLRQKGVPATLFMGGKWMRTHAGRVVQIMREPLFEIGSHAWTHGNFGIMAEEAMRGQIEGAQAQYAALREVALREAAEQGCPPPEIPACMGLFRLPYGRCSERALEVLAEYGLRVIQWDVAAEGGKDNASPAVARAAAGMVRPGSIILMHANLVPRGTAALVRSLVEDLEAQGYRFVKVSGLLGMGEPRLAREGYFSRPGDNLSLDARFGFDGTGRKRP